MIHHIEYKQEQFQFERYPRTSNRSLQAWNAGDHYVLQYIEGLDLKDKDLGIYQDRFGLLSVMLKAYNPRMIIEYSSQEKAIRHNFALNNLSADDIKIAYSLEDDYTIDIAVLKMPKSMDLFQLYLQQISKVLTSGGEVVVSFMTKSFTPQAIEIAQKYFENVEQTLAFKKSRLMILKGCKNYEENLIKTLNWNTDAYKQYLGVFSGNHIDYATQFMLEVFKVQPSEKIVLDLASGNGVIAKYLTDNNDIDQMHLIDDSFLAVESSKLNCTTDQYSFHFNDGLSQLENHSLDLVISNPPFHFDNENNIEVSIDLFSQVKEKLKAQGRFVLVANKHLNYWTHLDKLFDNTEVIAIDDKFEIYECRH